MSTTIKLLTQEHFQQSMDLSSFAFQYPLTSEQLEERKESFIGANQTRLGVFKNEHLCAQATLLDLQIYIAGQMFSMGGIAGVSTWPEHRRNGYVAKLLQQLLLQMKQKGHSVSMLHPFSFAFYRKFGWENYIDYKQYELDSDQLSAILKQQQRLEQKGQIVRLADWQPLKQVYEQYAERYNGMLHRPEHWWKERIIVRKKGIYAAYQDQQGNMQGYVMYEATNRQMNIHEFVALTYEAEQQLLLYIAQHDSMVEKVTWTAPVDDTFTFGLDNPRIKQEIIPYFMARIVDITTFAGQYPFAQAEQAEQYRITIVDDQAIWNNGMFILQISPEGKATIERIEEADRAAEVEQIESIEQRDLSKQKELVEQKELVKHKELDEQSTLAEKENISTEADITISIGALTAWLLNYQTWETLERFNKVEGSAAILKRLQKRISGKTTYLTDFF